MKFNDTFSLNVQGNLWPIDEPKVMGILNVTPDSFYDGGKHQHEADVIAQCQKMVEEEVDIIDVGGYSSRPGADDISVEEEKQRVKKALRLIKKEFPNQLISIDTFRAEVARLAIGEGAHMVNDISGGQLDAKMLTTAAELRIPYFAMHMRGTPQTMKKLTEYNNLLYDVLDYFALLITQLNELDIHDIIVDPGFGFAKTIDQNYELFHQLEQFHHLNLPLLVGVSRKSMIWKTLNTNANDALHGTTALHMLALQKGVHFLRVHDVKPAKDVIKVWKRLGDTAL